ncbi:hypothetical protein AC249_AIPGENE10810 [Exaiptasia diaphana]|nr:hypothetical protein AC249_AIPGENE10810 [Exaiptasia diaphana]
MDNLEAMETPIQEFYNNDNSDKNYDQSQCNYDHNSEQTSEELRAGYLDEFYNFPDANTFIQQFLQDADMPVQSDDIQPTEAVFQQLDIMVREQVDSEIEVFKENINKILNDQQLYFKQAFGLQDCIVANEPMHVVPSSGHEEEIVSGK